MTDYDPAVMRAVLREHGHEVPAKGRLGAQHVAAYEALVNKAPDGDGDEGDYDEGVSAADFPPDLDDRAAAAAPAPERRPKRVKAKPGAGLLSGLKAGRKPGRARPARHPRVPVDRFAARTWRMLARMATPVSPPIAACLSLQSPTAGLILEDVVKGTALDRLAQPLIRAEAKGEKVFALVAPAVLVGAIQAAQGLPDQERAVREAILFPMLREALVLNVEIAGDRLDSELARVSESAETAARVDAMLAQIFAPMMGAPAGDEPAPETGPEPGPAPVVTGLVVGA